MEIDELADVWKVAVINIFVVVVSMKPVTDFVVTVLADVVINVVVVIIVGMLTNEEITVVGAAVVVFTEDVLVAVLIGAYVGLLFILIIVVMTGSDVDLSAGGEYVKVSTPVVTGLRFAVAVPSEDSMRSR